MRLSVVICTRNRAQSVVRVLKVLDNQTADPADLEVIVVDNASTDGTREVVEKSRGGLKFPLQVVTEVEAGLSSARNTGLARAAGEFVAYLDDDAFPVARWAEAFLTALKSGVALAAGGRTVLAWPSAPPKWLSEEYHGLYGSFDKGESAMRLSWPASPIGANMAFSTAALRSVGGFDHRFGRSAGSLLSNEELVVFRRFEAHGHAVIYVPDALAVHHVHPRRTRVRWILERAHAQGMSDVILEDLAPARPSGIARDLGFAVFRGKRTVLRSYREAGIYRAAVTQGVLLSYAAGRMRQRSNTVGTV